MFQYSSISPVHYFARPFKATFVVQHVAAVIFSMVKRFRFSAVLAIFLSVLNNHCETTFGQSDVSSEVAAEEAPLTQWTNPQGKVVEADFVRMDGKVVILKLKSNGSEVKVPGTSLSLESYLQAVKLANPENFSKPIPEASKAMLASFDKSVPFTANEIVITPFGPESSIDQYLTTFEREFERYNLFVTWHMLSPTVQTELATAYADRANAISPALRTELNTTLKMVHAILRDKGTMILEMPEVKGNPEMLVVVQNNLPLVAHLFEGISRDELWQPSQFQAANFPRWLAEVAFTLSPIIKSLDNSTSDQNPTSGLGLSLSNLSPNASLLGGSNTPSEDIRDQPGPQLTEDTLSMPEPEVKGADSSPNLHLNVIFTVVSQSTESADVDLKFSQDEEAIRLSFAKENGMWYCKTWSEQIHIEFEKTIRPQLNKPIDSMAFSAVLIALNKGLLLSLQNAQTPQALSQALQDSMQMFGSLAGPYMQGIGPMVQPDAMPPQYQTPASDVMPSQTPQTPGYDPEFDPELAP